MEVLAAKTVNFGNIMLAEICLKKNNGEKTEEVFFLPERRRPKKCLELVGKLITVDPYQLWIGTKKWPN
jgi:hypothetical protein